MNISYEVQYTAKNVKKGIEMKNNKTPAFFFIILIMLFFMLSGCGADNDESTDNITFSYSGGLDEYGFFEGIRALDYIEIFNYHEMIIPAEVHEVLNDNVQSEIDVILAAYPARAQITGRAVADGDTVNIDYVGSIDGIEFDGGSTGGMGTDVTIGVTSYIDDFLDQLIGHTPGETVYVEVTFPGDYHEETLQGKDALFVTVINYIVEEREAELTDEYVLQNLYAVYGWANIDEMREGIRSELQNYNIQQYLLDYFTSNVNIKSIPDKLLEYQENAMLNSYQEYAGYSGMELDEYISSNEGYAGVDELIEAYYETNLDSAACYLVVQAVAEDMGISISDGDLADYFYKFNGSSDYSSYEEYYGLPYLKQIVLYQKVLDYIIQNAILL